MFKSKACLIPTLLPPSAKCKIILWKTGHSQAKKEKVFHLNLKKNSRILEMYENIKLRIENLIWMSYQILQRSCKVS